MAKVTAAKSPGKPRGFDAALAAVDAANELAPGEALQALRNALASRHGLVVSRAAKLAARMELRELTDELAQAFTRFMPENGDPVKSDPQCWAKSEIVKALAAFEYQEQELFLAGLKYRQLEPVWGGSSDTAGAVRGTCAMALVQCRELSSYDVLRHLTPLFCDKDIPVKVNAARAMEQVGSDAASLLLRLRAELGSDEPEVIGACIGGVLRIDGGSALKWVAGFLELGDDLSAEAAFVLAEQRSMDAVAVLQQTYTNARNRHYRGTLLSAIAAARLPEANEWLLSLATSGGLDARSAANALWNAQPSGEVAEKLKSLGFPHATE